MWMNKNGRMGWIILGFSGKKLLVNFMWTLLIKIFKVPFLAIWSLVGGARGRFLTLQVNLHVASFWLFRNTCLLNLILTEREVQCSLTAETRANGKVNFSTIYIRPLSYYVMLGGEHYWRRHMRNCMDLTRPWMVETSLMHLLTSLEGWVKCKVKDKCKDKDIRVSWPNDIHIMIWWHGPIW